MPQAMGALVGCSEHRASGSRYRMVPEGVALEVLVAWAAHLGNRPSRSGNLVCALRASLLKIPEPGWGVQGIELEALRGWGGAFKKS